MSHLVLPVVITPSRVELGLRCYRRHVLADLLQRHTFYSPSLEFGSVIHAGAGAWWAHANKDGNEARQLALFSVEAEWHKRFTANPQVSQKDLSLDLAIAMIRSYTNLASMNGPFGLEPGDWQFVTVEDRLEVPLALPNKGHGKLSFQTDRAVYNHSNSHLVIVDTKTSARMDKRWERQWETSLQMKLYKAGAAKAYDFDIDQVDIVIEGVLKEPKSDIKYVVCPNWSQGFLDEAVRQAVSIAQRDEALIRTGGLPKDVALIEEEAVNKTELNYQCCYEYGLECPFRKLCIAEPDERVGILHADYFEMEEELY